MPKTLQNVAIAGPSGNIGREILKHLLQNDRLTITALVRKPSNLPAEVRTRVVDFTSADSLASALRNQDVVIDALNTTDDTSINLINAASAAGVRRYIPPDFGLDPENTEMMAIPAFYGRAARDRHLAEVCQRTGMTWTIVCNGAFLDWNLRSGFMGIDIYGKKATLLDGGSNPHVWTTLDAAGKATAEILKHPEETENRPVYVHSVVKSEKQMVDLARAALGGDSWAISEQNGKQVFETALADFKAGIYTYQVFGGMVIYANTRADIAHPWPKSDNALLGVKEMSDAEVVGLIKKLAAERQK